MEAYVLIKDVPVGGNPFSPHRERSIVGIYTDFPSAYEAQLSARREIGVLNGMDYYIESHKLKGEIPSLLDKMEELEDKGLVVEASLNEQMSGWKFEVTDLAEGKSTVRDNNYATSLDALAAGTEYARNILDGPDGEEDYQQQN